MNTQNSKIIYLQIMVIFVLPIFQCAFAQESTLQKKRTAVWEIGIGLQLKGNLCPWQPFELKPCFDIKRGRINFSIGQVIDNKIRISVSAISLRPGITISGMFIETDFDLFRKNKHIFSIGAINELSRYRWYGNEVDSEFKNKSVLYKFDILTEYSFQISTQTNIQVSSGIGVAFQHIDIFNLSFNQAQSYTNKYFSSSLMLTFIYYF